ncbi:MAG: translesion DNA synthesis-associated protein ImuA [Burkholderiaceae bacterium]
MASLPLFPSSFMPLGTASFVPSRPATVLPAIRPVAAPPVLKTPAVIPLAVIPSPVERTEATLRQAGLGGRLWRGDSLSVSPLPSTPSGFRSLDEQLPGGGWPSRCLTELLIAHPGVGEIRFLAATLSSLTQSGREIVLLAPPHIPDPTGWEQLGIDMRRVMIVHTPRPADRLWAIQESLKSSAFGALVAWLPEDKALARHDALRRLQSAAASADGLSFLIRPSAAQYHASPAPLRLTLAVGEPDAHRRTLSVRLLKRRGPVLARPLTLLLPEIHRGMKVFSLLSASTSSASSNPLPASTGAQHIAARPAPHDAHTKPSHALAGPLLSDAAA